MLKRKLVGFILTLLLVGLVGLIVNFLKYSPSAAPPLVLEDDNLEAYYDTINGYGSGEWQFIIDNDPSIKYSGVDSLKINQTSGGSFTQPYLEHDYGPEISYNWSVFTGFYFYWYGANTGAKIHFVIFDVNASYAWWEFTDNYRGWKIQKFTFNNPSGGLCDLEKVRRTRIHSLAYSAGVWYFDSFGLWGGPTGNTPPSNGDWWPIALNTANKNWLLNGSIRIAKTTNFTLKDSTIRFNLHLNEQYGIEVLGKMHLVNVTIKSENASARYFFDVRSEPRWPYGELYINQSSVIYNATEIFVGNGNYMEANNTEIAYVQTGVFIADEGRAELDLLTVHDMTIGVCIKGANSHVYNSTFFNFRVYCVDISGSRAHHNTVINCTGHNGHEVFRIGNYYPHHNQIINCTAYDANWGFVLQHNSHNNTIRDCTAFGMVESGIQIEMYSQDEYVYNLEVYNCHTGFNIKDNVKNITLERCNAHNNTANQIQVVNNAVATFIDVFSQVEISTNANLIAKYTAKNFTNGFIQLFKHATKNVQVYVEEEPSPEFTNNILTFYTKSKTNVTGMFEVYTGEHGRPDSVKINGTTINCSYNSSTSIVSFNVTLTPFNVRKIEIIWEQSKVAVMEELDATMTRRTVLHVGIRPMKNPSTNLEVFNNDLQQNACAVDSDAFRQSLKTSSVLLNVVMPSKVSP